MTNKVKISPYTNKKIQKFASDRLSGSKGLYAYRGESREYKIKQDIVVGTAGEYGIYNHIKNLGYKCSKPDLTIYESKRKSYDEDLHADGFDIHVKSQSTESSKRYGNSWLFQRSDSLVQNPSDSDILAFTCVDDASMIVTILGYATAEDILMNCLWEECKVWSYRKTKVALYLPSLQEAGILKSNFNSLFKRSKK